MLSEEIKKPSPTNNLTSLEEQFNKKYKEEVADIKVDNRQTYFDTKDVSSDMEESVLLNTQTDSSEVSNFNQYVADVATTRINTNGAATPTVSMESVELGNTSAKKLRKKSNSASKSLKENEELIDFLFVAM